ncbi:MAG: aminotransferase class I/II-fold pyridoxal phosphate-dependent enzyme [Clostridia bacterium]|nr:aminotransferase class I/II-fold pyridoxal phosphate-dependent enzyme [Clostridia bacterium]
MNTPIADFVRRYAASGTARLHMPGHKGRAFLGCEPFDITEIAGADSLYEASGVIAQSEANASLLFGSARTLYATEGSSQCIRAMLHLCLCNRKPGTKPVIVAARNVHKAFVFACALLDFEIVWLWPQSMSSLCACEVSLEALESTLASLDAPPAAVYITSPDYLGGMADVAQLADICHAHGTLLAVDNAHGAYLRFLSPSLHPMDLGADICCDSAHKTLGVLTGGAYLHIGRNAPAAMAAQTRQAMALFGSTSPSYLTLMSLDLCNARLAHDYPARLENMVSRIALLRLRLAENGWHVLNGDPLKLTLDARAAGTTGTALAQRLRDHGIECEFADPETLVLMLTPENQPQDLARLEAALGKSEAAAQAWPALSAAKGARAMSVREAMFAPHETIPAENALGRICGAPTVACPPAIPVAVSGEIITKEALELFMHYGVDEVDVVKE